jgi:predicted CXXCH cytochrome family protein
MTRNSTRSGAGGGQGAALAPFLLAGLLALSFAASGQEMPESVEYCLACHSDPDLTMPLDDGSELSLGVDSDQWMTSVHGDQLVCTDCHEGYEEDHPDGDSFASERTYELLSYELCKKCHFDTYTRTLESVHYGLLKEGVDLAPVCTDCHGAHEIADPHAKQAMMSRSCGDCHSDVYRVYAESVHGRALVEDHIQEVPGCADCHTAHSIVDPGTARFHLASPEVCIRCHGDDELMAGFGIPTTVATTYMQDFHGVTASLAQHEEIDERQLVVTCVDCHGVHDIAAPAALAPEVMKARVEQVCADCHQGAAQDFPAAWLSHYPPSLDHAPLVFLIDWMYRLLIPFMVLGLGLQVLLHLYRFTFGR